LAAREVRRASATLTHQLAQFCQATISDANEDEVLRLATFVAFARQTGDAARRALALHRSVVVAVGRAEAAAAGEASPRVML
jgi:hypothetical protein